MVDARPFLRHGRFGNGLSGTWPLQQYPAPPSSATDSTRLARCALAASYRSENTHKVVLHPDVHMCNVTCAQTDFLSQKPFTDGDACIYTTKKQISRNLRIDCTASAYCIRVRRTLSLFLAHSIRHITCPLPHPCLRQFQRDHASVVPFKMFAAPTSLVL